MLLAELNGMLHDEIAAQMRLTRNAVYKLGHDSRRTLRRALEAVRHHITRCGECREEYEALLTALKRMQDEEGR
jgi:hypothetical protein